MTDRPFGALIARYDLRDGHAPAEPFVAAPNQSFLPPGWLPLAQQLIEDLLRLGWDRRVLQIKEKYGTLRFYVTQREDRLLERIEAAMELSASVCEECGADGTWLDDKGPMCTLCAPCRARLRAESGKA
jgi:hypothetical protein